jgi:hypothetical protein
MSKFPRAAVAVLLTAVFLAAGCEESGIQINETYKVASMLTSCPANPWHKGMGTLTYTLDIIKLLDTNTLDTDALVTKAMFICMIGADECSTFNTCYQPTPNQTAKACAQGVESACVDGSLIRCTGDDFPPMELCFEAGLQCIPLGTTASCGIQECPPERAPYCEGDKLYTCQSGTAAGKGALYLRDCRHEGGTCGQKATGGYDCIGTGGACTNEGQLACDGQYITSCMNGFGTRYDCRKIDKSYTCKPDNKIGAVCLAESSNCDKYTNESCGSDGTITFCYFGKTTKLNCRNYGLTGCGTAVNDSSQTVAFCTN